MKLTAAFAALAAVQRGWGLMAEAAKYEQQVRALNNLAASYNSNGNKIIADLKRISDGTINTITLVEKAGTAMMLGIAPEKISKLMEIARATARMTGQEVSTAFDNIAMAVGRQSKMILDNLGIIVSVESANRTYAVQLKKTADNLSDTEKKAAFLNATIAAGEDLIARMGQQSDTTKDKMDRLKASVDNARLMIGQGLIRVVLGATGAFQWLAAGVMTVIAIIPKLLEYMARANAKIYEWTGQTERMKASLSEAASLKKGYEDMLGAAGELAGKAADNFSAMVSSTEDMAGATNRAIPPIDGVTDTLDAAAKAAQKLREEWAKLKAELDFEKATAGMDDLDKKLAEIERDIAKMRANPNADLKLIDEIELQRQTAAIKAWYDEYLQEQIKAKENFDRQEKAKQDSIAKGAQETADAIKKQYDADGQLLRDKLELYKDLTGFEDEYRQVQLDWIERIKKEEIKATGDVAAAEKKAAKERAQIEYNLFKTKTDYIASGFGQLQSAFTEIAGVYEKGSDAARQWEQAAKAMEIAQKAVAVVQAVAAIATQGLGDPYTAFARIAAMAATMGALLATIGESVGGGGGSSVKSAPSYAFSSSVLGGEAGAESESLKKSWEYLEETYDMEYEKLTKIYNELKNLNSNITGLVTSIVRPGGVSYAGIDAGEFKSSTAQFIEDKFDNLVGLITAPFRAIGLGFLDPLGKLVGGWVSSAWNSIFGGNMTRTITGQGIQLSIPSVSAMLSGANVGARSYTSVHEHTEGGWFHSDKNKYYSLYGEVSAQVTDLFASVFTNISGTLVELAKGLGQDVNAALGYFFGPIEINLQGMNAEQINKAILEHVSAMSDAAVDALFGQLLKGYQELGESLTTTAVRLMVDKEIVLEVLEQTRQSYTSTVEDTIAFSEALIKLAGDLETLTDVTSKYYKSFMTEEEKQIDLQEQLTITLGDFNAILPATRNAYRSLVEGLDLTTDHGRYAYITLLKLAETADGYYSYLEDLANTRFEFENELLELQGKAEEALARERQKELDAMDSTLRPLQQLVWLTQDWAEKISQANSEAADAISQQISLASSAASASRSAANEYRNIIKSLTDAQESIRGGSTAEMQQRFESLFAIAMTGDRKALSALPGAAGKLLAGSLASSTSALDYARDQGKMLLALEQAKTISEGMVDWNEYHATLLETQVSVLEQIRDELGQENPNLDALERQAGLLESIGGLLQQQTTAIVNSNGEQVLLLHDQNGIITAANVLTTTQTGQIALGNSWLEKIKTGITAEIINSNLIIRDQNGLIMASNQLLVDQTGKITVGNTLTDEQTAQVIAGNATQDVIANLSSLDTSYSAEMLNALVSREVSQANSLENILTANTTTVSLLRRLVDLTTASAMEKSLAEIKSAYETIQSASTSLQTAMATNNKATQTLAAAQGAASQAPLTLADVLAKNAGTAYSSANAPAQPGVYSEALGRMSKEQLITNLFNSGLGSVITQKEYSYIATNYNDRWQGYAHYYLDENGVLRSAAGGSYHADLGEGWSTGGPTSSAYITAGVQASLAANESAKQSAVVSALAATQQAMKEVETANQKLAEAQAFYSALVSKYETTYGTPPGFASGGPFSGGLRIVGENGPELEYTGPSHIVNASKTEALLNNNVVLIEELRALRSELKAGLYQTAKNTGQTARVLDRTLTKWDEIGLPAEATP